MKRQRRIANRTVDRLWRGFYASLAFEDIGAEKGTLEEIFYYDFEHARLCIPYSLSDMREYLESEYGDKLRVIDSNECGEPFTLESLIDKLARASLVTLKDLYFENFAKEEKEQAFILPYKVNELLILEGERDKISLISFPSFLFFHSHPVGKCLPSKADLLTFRDFILSGGYVFGILSNDCALAVYKRWPLSEIDFLNLLMVIRNLGERGLLRLRNNEGKIVVDTLLM